MYFETGGVCFCLFVMIFCICHLYCILGQVEIVFVNLVLDLSLRLYFQTGGECFCLFVMTFLYLSFLSYFGTG